jgi:hypothetical protein
MKSKYCYLLYCSKWWQKVESLCTRSKNSCNFAYVPEVMVSYPDSTLLLVWKLLNWIVVRQPFLAHSVVSRSSCRVLTVIMLSDCFGISWKNKTTITLLLIWKKAIKSLSVPITFLFDLFDPELQAGTSNFRGWFSHRTRKSVNGINEVCSLLVWCKSGISVDYLEYSVDNMFYQNIYIIRYKYIIIIIIKMINTLLTESLTGHQPTDWKVYS